MSLIELRTEYIENNAKSRYRCANIDKTESYFLCQKICKLTNDRTDSQKDGIRSIKDIVKLNE